MNESAMHHGRHWAGQRVRGWFASEKYRGCRAFWDGATMWTRGGLQVQLPAAWRAELPEGRQLDGEIWAGHGPENGPEECEASAAAVHGRFTDRLRFMVFDAPDVLAPWSERMAAAVRLLGASSIVCPVPFRSVTGIRDLEMMFAAVVRAGGEGLMVRSPSGPAHYEPGRTGTLLKVKRDPALARGVVRLLAKAA